VTRAFQRRWSGWRGALGRHRWPLLILTGAMALVQAIVIAHRVAIPAALDTSEYLAAAADILSRGQLISPLRTPGYPLFLDAIFLLRGGRQDLVAVVAAQAALVVVTAYEIYLLTYRLTGRMALACLAAALVGTNVFVIDWQFSIRPEALSYWTVVTLFLLVERMLGGLRASTVAWFAALSLFAAMVRPLYLFVPILLLAALFLRGLRLGRWREYALKLGLALLFVYGCTAGYSALNGALNGYNGITYPLTIQLFGKVIEYHMQDLPVSPELTPVQRAAVRYARGGGRDPYAFAHENGFDADYYAALDPYAKYVILHHPAEYAVKSLGDLARWWDLPVQYAPYSSPVATVMRAVSRAALGVYYLLPLLAVLVLVRLRRAPADPRTFIFALMLLLNFASDVINAGTAYWEWYRYRFPLDWSAILIATVLLWEGAAWLQRRRALSRGAPGREPASSRGAAAR